MSIRKCSQNDFSDEQTLDAVFSIRVNFAGDWKVKQESHVHDINVSAKEPQETSGHRLTETASISRRYDFEPDSKDTDEIDSLQRN
jgi:hypothetical protein